MQTHCSTQEFAAAEESRVVSTRGHEPVTIRTVAWSARAAPSWSNGFNSQEAAFDVGLTNWRIASLRAAGWSSLMSV
jgi:hypothetical protein